MSRVAGGGLVLGFVVAAFGCEPTLQNGVYRCDATHGCPSGFACIDGRCWLGGSSGDGGPRMDGATSDGGSTGDAGVRDAGVRDDGGGTDDGGTPPLVAIGEVIAYQGMSTAAATFLASAGFYQPCTVSTTVAECRVVECPSTVTSWPDAGEITFSNPAGTTVRLTPGPSGIYPPNSFGPPLWESDASLVTIQAPGRAMEVPSFDVTLAPPSSLEGDLLTMVAEDGLIIMQSDIVELSLSRVPSESVVVYLASGDESRTVVATCRFSPAPSVVVPSSVTAMLVPTTYGTFIVATATTELRAVDGWTISLEVWQGISLGRFGGISQGALTVTAP